MGDVEEDADAQPLQVVREMRCAVCGKRHRSRQGQHPHAIIGIVVLTLFMVVVTLLISCTEPADASSDGGEAYYVGLASESRKSSPLSLDAWCPQDPNHDGFVDITDIAMYGAYFGKPTPPAPADYDLQPIASNGDGYVDISDIVSVGAGFGSRCYLTEESLSVPNPFGQVTDCTMQIVAFAKAYVHPWQLIRFEGRTECNVGPGLYATSCLFDANWFDPPTNDWVEIGVTNNNTRGGGYCFAYNNGTMNGYLHCNRQWYAGMLHTIYYDGHTIHQGYHGNDIILPIVEC